MKNSNVNGFVIPKNGINVTTESGDSILLDEKSARTTFFGIPLSLSTLKILAIIFAIIIALIIFSKLFLGKNLIDYVPTISGTNVADETATPSASGSSTSSGNASAEQPKD